MDKKSKFLLMVISLLVAIILAWPTIISYAGPPAAPTPISNIVNFPEKSRVRTVYPVTAIAADTNTSSFCFGETFEQADYGILVDHGTTNTTTFIIQFSMDGTNWDVGPTLLSANAADAIDISRVQLFGKCQRINIDVVNTNTITIGILALPK